MIKTNNIINEEITVGSSAIVTAAYSHTAKELTVMFISGVRYIYKDVEYADFVGLKYASSCGKYFNRVIKDTYDYEIIKEDIQEFA